MAEGNKRQAAVVFVIAGVFLVGLLLVGLGMMKQQNKNAAQQPNTGTQPNHSKPKKQAEPKQDKPPASNNQQSGNSPETPAAVAPQPDAAELPATGSASDFLLGSSLLACLVFAIFRFRQSKVALLPKL